MAGMEIRCGFMAWGRWTDLVAQVLWKIPEEKKLQGCWEFLTVSRLGV